MGRGNKNNGLGKALIRTRFRKNAGPRHESTRHTMIDDDRPNWLKMQSITQENDLDEFLRTAELAGTEFTAERLNVKVVTNSYQNPYLLSAQEEKATLRKHEEHRQRLTVPRRPKWDENTTREELLQAENESFLAWRRGLAELQEEHGLILTPFEKNIEVWRQLWRVIERSDLVVQIVDARNPLFFYSTDLVTYVKEIDDQKKCLLLVNKADMLTPRQRRYWSDYFDKHQISYLYFSALKAGTATTTPLTEEVNNTEAEQQVSDVKQQLDTLKLTENDKEEEVKVDTVGAQEEEEDERIRILSAEELVERLVKECPSVEGKLDGNGQQRKMNIGLVGYPNVGKSSTINALVGAKRVAVGATPGKTKHFQTIHLDDRVLLCDCPGLVFPSFVTTQAEMVCNGVLPIDQLREYTGPVALVARHIPKWFIEATYGINIVVRSEEEGGTGEPTAEEILVAYATARGFMRSGMGTPDESRAARYILKDYVAGKLLYCYPPPDSVSPEEFNKEIHDPQKFESMFERKKPVGEARQVKTTSGKQSSAKAPGQASSSRRVNALDNAFFNKHYGAPRIRGRFADSGEFTRVKLYPHQMRVADDGTVIRDASRQEAIMANFQDKKKSHKKGKKHIKNRHRDGYDD